MTVKLYEDDSRLTEFTAVVRSCGAAGKGFAVVLDRTAFFPEGGGQPADRGKLGGVCVTDVQEKDGEIVHLLSAPLEEGRQVFGAVDAARRFDHMQQHTADHIFSALVHRRFGFDNVGFHIGEDATHMDFSGEITPQQIDGIETAANEAVMRDLPVTVSYPPADELRTMEFRSKKELGELSGRIRIVTVGDLDVCACCGTHVARTGELGLIKIISSANYKGGVRVFMLAGGRAAAFCQAEHRRALQIGALLSAKQETLPEAVGRLKDDAAAAHLAAGRLQAELLEYKAQAFAGRDTAVAFEQEVSPDDLRRYALLLVEKGARVGAVFCGADGNFRYAVAADPKRADARELGKKMNAQLSGRGGGKPELIQGSVACAKAAVEQFFAAE